MKKLLAIAVVAMATLAACAGSAFNVDDRVWAEWSTNNWYLGTVTETCTDGDKEAWTVEFDDSGDGCYALGQILADEPPTGTLKVGDPVIGFWATDSHYYTAEIAEVSDEGYKIKYYDGVEFDVEKDQVILNK